jgi:hypothetical protein
VPSFLFNLVSRDAGRRFVAADLVYLYTVVADLSVQVFENVAGQVLCRWIEFLVERRQLVDIPMVEITHNIIRCLF